MCPCLFLIPRLQNGWNSAFLGMAGVKNQEGIAGFAIPGAGILVGAASAPVWVKKLFYSSKNPGSFHKSSSGLPTAGNAGSCFIPTFYNFNKQLK